MQRVIVSYLLSELSIRLSSSNVNTSQIFLEYARWVPFVCHYLNLAWYLINTIDRTLTEKPSRQT